MDCGLYQECILDRVAPPCLFTNSELKHVANVSNRSEL
jgi:hypothetical protein